MARSICRGTCGLTFAGLADFDKHQTVANDRRATVTCLPPADVGLVKRDGGIWGSPVPTGSDRPKHWGQTEPRPPKVFNCADCSLPFQNTPGRGRPPTRCTDCGGKGIPCQR